MSGLVCDVVAGRCKGSGVLIKACRDPSLFASVLDYLAVEKGWFSPYLFASGRRPAIPRTMKPDVVFCHGPFLNGRPLY